MITDIHVHHVPEPFARFIEKSAPYLMHRDSASGQMITLNVGPLRYGLNRTFFDPERLIKRMQEMRVDHAVLSLATPFVKFDVPPSLGIETAQLYNDEIARMHRAAPDTFDGWAFLPMQDPEAAANELRRAVRNLGLIGGYLPSNVKGRWIRKNLRQSSKQPPNWLFRLWFTRRIHRPATGRAITNWLSSAGTFSIPLSISFT
jgi:aminocarboxymuconate-semialdehyde decarboxylase